MYPDCHFGIHTQSPHSSSFKSFLHWIYQGEDDDPVQVNKQLLFEGQSLHFSSNPSSNVLIIFQTDDDEAVSFIENITANVILVFTQETELDQIGIDVVVRSYLHHHFQHFHLPSPSLFLKTDQDRQFILRMLVNLYHILLGTLLHPKLKSQRHTLLYDLCDEFLPYHLVE